MTSLIIEEYLAVVQPGETREVNINVAGIVLHQDITISPRKALIA